MALLSSFVLLCICHLHSSPDLHPPTETMYQLNTNYPFPLPLATGIHHSTFWLWIWLTLGTSLQRNHAVFVCLWLPYFTELNVYSIPPYCSMYQNFSFLMLIFSCVCLPYFIYSSVTRHLSFFYLLSIINNVAMKVGVQISACTSFGYMPGVEFLDQMIVLFLIFWGFAILFSTTAAPFCVPISSA